MNEKNNVVVIEDEEKEYTIFANIFIVASDETEAIQKIKELEKNGIVDIEIINTLEGAWGVAQ